jgi:HlyD family secretion protein
MKNKRVVAAVLTLAVLVSGAWVFLRKSGTEAPEYRFVRVQRGDIEANVSATGTLSAVTTVQVGTQVSGQVSAIYVDFNDNVRRGQLLARIDPTLAEQSVREAEAQMARAAADLEQAQREYDRNKALFDSQIVTDKEMTAVKYALQVAQANQRSAQISVERARRSLGYTEITAPVDGKVVERNVDAGQTVAASLSTPQLFLIAKDLSEMQILASVDESDIGAIKVGQEAHFSVPAYDGQTFKGTVKQVRLQSATQENVVSYTVVVSVDNSAGKLLPGMTATVDFVTSAARGVFTVPNAALRFRPDSTRTRRPSLWVLDANQKVVPVAVKPGITDGTKTEVSGELKEGMEIILGKTSGGTANAPAASPFQGQQQQQRGPRPGGF